MVLQCKVQAHGIVSMRKWCSAKERLGTISLLEYASPRTSSLFSYSSFRSSTITTRQSILLQDCRFASWTVHIFARSKPNTYLSPLPNTTNFVGSYQSGPCFELALHYHPTRQTSQRLGLNFCLFPGHERIVPFESQVNRLVKASDIVHLPTLRRTARLGTAPMLE